MPGPVSDAYDPVWGTADNAETVRDGIRQIRLRLSLLINSPPAFILDVIRGCDGPTQLCPFTERELRILRYACGVALEEEDL